MAQPSTWSFSLVGAVSLSPLSWALRWCTFKTLLGTCTSSSAWTYHLFLPSSKFSFSLRGTTIYKLYGHPRLSHFPHPKYSIKLCQLHLQILPFISLLFILITASVLLISLPPVLPPSNPFSTHLWQFRQLSKFLNGPSKLLPPAPPTPGSGVYLFLQPSARPCPQHHTGTLNTRAMVSGKRSEGKTGVCVYVCVCVCVGRCRRVKTVRSNVLKHDFIF